MERDDMLIAIAKMQQSQEDILRRLDDMKSEMKEQANRLDEIVKYMYYAGGALALISAFIPYIWTYVKERFFSA